MLRLLIIRHGETCENTGGIIQGQSRGTLSEAGKGQIELLAKRLSGEKIDLAFSSDLERAVDTTHAVLRYHDCKLHFVPDLRERRFGIFEGRTGSDYTKTMESSSEKWHVFRPEGGESLADVFERTGRFLDKIMLLPRPVTCLISTHGGPARCLISKLRNQWPDGFWSINQHNACVNSVVIRENQAIEELIDCTAHLDTGASLPGYP